MGLMSALFGARADRYVDSLLREFNDASVVAERGVAQFNATRDREEEAKRVASLNAPRHVHNFVNGMSDKPCDGADLLMLAKLYAVRFIVDSKEPVMRTNPERWLAAREIIGEAVRQSSLILDLCGSPYGKDLGSKSVRSYFAEHIVLNVLGQAHQLWLQH